MNKSPFYEYIEKVESSPNKYSKMIVKQIALQREMLKIFDFNEDHGDKAVKWIETFCILPEGEKAGETVKLLLWQKWFIYSILCFYGYFDEVKYNKNGENIGVQKEYCRVVKDVMLIVATGNAKTTLFAFLNAYFLFGKEFKNPNIFIGSNSHKQSRICFDATMDTIIANYLLKSNARIVESRSMIKVSKTNATLQAMSSKGENQEGIIPAIIVIDETHEMKTSEYADNLRKATKRSDLLVLESSTHGTVRGGYLDQRLEYARNVLNGESEEKDYRTFFAIYEQDSEEEVFKAFEENNIDVYQKSNPSLAFAVSPTLLKEKVKEMINDSHKKVVNMTKNFNIPQNAESCFFTKGECQTKSFNEEILKELPVFIGLDMAWTRSPSADLTAIRLLSVNPLNDDRFTKDIYFIPKYYDYQYMEKGVIETERKDMIELKSKQDTNILYNKKRKEYGYQKYADRGDVVIVDEELIEKLVGIYGEGARCDCSGITEDFVIYYLAYLEKEYKFKICKFGLDPNKATKIESYFNNNVNSMDGKDICVKFQMERANISNPILERIKDLRNRGKIYNNNKLTELHFASAQSQNTQYGFKLINTASTRKDGVIAEAAAESAYNVFTTNKFTGNSNIEMLKEWWSKNETEIYSKMEK